MRDVDYIRHEFHHEPERRIASLPHFLLDIPYLFLSGVIPPLRVMNEVLKHGGGDGGMSPGASWKPFAVTDEEYAELVEELLTLDVAVARKYARYVPLRIVEDTSLHRHYKFVSWLRAAKEKHGVADR